MTDERIDEVFETAAALAVLSNRWHSGQRSLLYRLGCYADRVGIKWGPSGPQIDSSGSLDKYRRFYLAARRRGLAGTIKIRKIRRS